ncbi:MAG: tRNA (adenosine(37)-N6)-threonylcarbamoyltransferase complex ATPase subunit type 1 TsaE [Prevotella sp.]|nr:tRNA (adenosine(37)-N6)-threonylcarbamoyltransferase complex ATPase subunit type 1 TsaE [Candidatus Equicola stercoris]
MHIVIAGNIGSGKTTLTKMLAKHYGWKPKFESVTFNPYLEDYYKDMKRWSFCLEVYFLKERFKDCLEIADSNDVIVQDRSIFEGVHVFAANNMAQGNLSKQDFETYMNLFSAMMSVTPKPNLMIYLKSSLQHLVAQIQKRGREYEQSMPIEYLQGLNQRYDDFIYNKYKGRVLIVETDGIDFKENPKDFATITDRIDSLLYGLFSEQK